MNLSHAVMLFIAFVVCLSSFTVGQQCTPLKDTYAKQCGTLGVYNQTFKLPYKMSPKARDTVSKWISMTFKEMENCSTGAAGELLTCSAVYAPSCSEEQQTHPNKLPCRRVCSEFLKGCAMTSDHMIYFASYILSLCSLLPNSTASSGECLEPPGFDKHYNASTTGLLEGGCSDLIIPWCQGLNYTHTILSKEIQTLMYKWFYNKNMTGDPVVDAQFDNTSFVDYMESTIQKIPKCARNYKKLICAETFPPCFPGEGVSFYTLCSSNCKAIETECPEIKESSDEYIWIPECELMSFANGSSLHGFCKHTSWPNPHLWLHELEEYFGVKPTEKPKTKGVSGGIIAAAVVVPIVVIVCGIFGVFLWRTRMLPWRYFGLKADDRKELVTE